MFSVKIISENNRTDSVLLRTISKLSDFLKKDMSREVNIVSDSKSIEMVSGNLDTNNDDIVTELMIKKTITIKGSDLGDRQKLDKYVREVKHFCEQAATIEDVEYLPINFRE